MLYESEHCIYDCERIRIQAKSNPACAERMWRGWPTPPLSATQAMPLNRITYSVASYRKRFAVRGKISFGKQYKTTWLRNTGRLATQNWPFGNAKLAVWQRKTGRLAMQDRPYCIAKQPIRHHRRHGTGKPLWLSRLRHKADKETTFTETSAITVAWRLRGGTYTTAATPRIMPAARTLNARTAWRRRPTGVGWHGLAAAPTAMARRGKPGKHTIPQ